MEDDPVFAELTTECSIHEADNEALEHFAGRDDLEALVLVHEDTEILDAGFCATVRRTLRDPRVAIAGPIGARGVRSLAWWEGEIAGAVSETRGRVSGDAGVDALNGLMLVLSPWAVRNLRCDTQTFAGFHAYDIDPGFGDLDAWRAANAAFAAKWG